MKDILSYDITPPLKLFEDTRYMTKAAKYELVIELEKHLNRTESRLPHASGQCLTAYLVDIMATIRQTPTKGSVNFGEYCSAICGKIKAITTLANRVDMVYDSYKTGTIKDSERKRRCTVRPIETVVSLSL